VEILIDQINERIGLGLSVIGDELSDFVQISLGTGMETNHRHLLRMRPTCLFSSGIQGVGSPLPKPSWMLERSCWSFTALS
jgi:hypothetical protein